MNGKLIVPLACLLVLAVASCDTTDTSIDATLTPTDMTIIPASPTVAPVAPTANDQDSSNLNVLQFTPRARMTVVAGTQVFPTPTAGATETTIKMQFAMSDGLSIVGTFYSAPHRPAPAALLLPPFGSNKEVWQSVAIQLQSAGYSVLAIDVRGFGETGGGVNWTLVPGDVVSILNQLHALPGVDPNRISVIGANLGSNLALAACATANVCHSVVLLSPSLDEQGIKTTPALSAYGKNPILIVASQDEKPAGADSQTLNKAAQGDHTLQLYTGTASGMNLFAAHPDLAKVILAWLVGH